MPPLQKIAAAAALVLSLPSLAAVIQRSANETARILNNRDAEPLHPVADGLDWAPNFQLKFQPLVDFDTDSCYNVPAMDAQGTASSGLEPSSSVGPCRPRSALDRGGSNVYVRGRCNRGWCALVFAYYFQMDWAWGWPFSSYNHRHDWEHVVVWAKQGQVRSVSVSCHGDYESCVAGDDRLRFGSTPNEFPYPSPGPAPAAMHPKVVFHKDGVRTHCFRFAKDSDDYEGQENDRGVWIRSGLVGMLMMPTDWVEKLRSHDWGSAHLAWASEDGFTGHLVETMPQEARNDEFDCAYDEIPGVQGFPSDLEKWT
ncbi:necrosis inducing protein-domain-containing protein [Parachaetomium inaequale]|uniref:Necrosis inducing protein-domain-containing protein n=1 Tax=Parachaetomium inaequale TaxID=2588326 RepID=A0AAN6PJS2_9PEZI|nr:necrosis inducing protein-domain-containing protein [Parachaetomium inaequale]